MGCSHRFSPPRFDIGGIKTLQCMRHTGAKLGEILQFMLGDIERPKQRIAEHLIELGKEAVLVDGRQLAQIDFVGFRKPQQDLRADRTLIAFDQIDVARRDSKSGGYLRLRQAELSPDAAKARSDEELSAICLL